MTTKMIRPTGLSAMEAEVLARDKRLLEIDRDMKVREANLYMEASQAYHRAIDACFGENPDNDDPERLLSLQDQIRGSVRRGEQLIGQLFDGTISVAEYEDRIQPSLSILKRI